MGIGSLLKKVILRKKPEEQPKEEPKIETPPQTPPSLDSSKLDLLQAKLDAIDQRLKIIESLLTQKQQPPQQEQPKKFY